MRIATMVKGYLTVPTPKDIVYAPSDLALQLGRGLYDRHHTVDFYAPRGSQPIPNQLIDLATEPLAHNYDEFQSLLFSPGYASDNVLAQWDQLYAAEMFKRAAAGDYDILHFHHPEVALPFVKIYPDIPVVYTMHDPIDSMQQKILSMYESENQHFISISDKQREPARDLSWLATIYNGIDTRLFQPVTHPTRDYLLFLGSILPRKGTKEAVEIARASGKKLVIAGPTYPDNQSYFDEFVAPYVDGDQFTYLGHVNHDDTAALFANAEGFLMPIQWEEPFGLTMAEALACGTPVVAMNRGSVPEIIDDGKTGYVCNTTDEMIERVKQLGQIDPEVCRQTAIKKFSVDAMVNGYEKAFESLF
jgi:glycosyltransferase involved in cell wall biosynthesis